MSDPPKIDPAVPPSGSGCVECDATGGWWFHLRRCAKCGRIREAATLHLRNTPATTPDAGHPVVRSFEPGEDWFWDYVAQDVTDGPDLVPPNHHPLDQPAPGPAAASRRTGSAI